MGKRGPKPEGASLNIRVSTALSKAEVEALDAWIRKRGDYRGYLLTRSRALRIMLSRAVAADRALRDLTPGPQ